MGTTGRRRGIGIGIVGRLLLVHATVMVITVIAIGVVTHRQYAHDVERAAVDELDGEITEFERAAAMRPGAQSLPTFSDLWVQIHPEAHNGPVLLVSVDDGSGATHLAASEGGKALGSIDRVSAWLATTPGKAQVTDVGVDGHQMRALARAVTVDGSIVGSMVVASELRSIRRLGRQQLQSTSVEAALALVVALLMAYLLLRRVMRGVATITTTANEISHSNLDRRLAWTGPDDELHVLADTVDGMLARLALAFRNQSRLLAEVSHQLRTPLTVIRGHLEVQTRAGFANQTDVAESVGIAIDQLDHVTGLVQRLLVYGRAMQPNLDDEPVSVTTVVERAYAAGSVLADRQWELRDESAGARVVADADQLHGALLNLIDNATNATASGDTIRLVTSQTADTVTVTVTDTGRGMSAADRRNALDRSIRHGDGERGGLALGLAIVAAVVETSGGSMSIESAQGLGTTVRLTFPRGAAR